jgi:high affinity Mn2+ porin
MRRIGIVVTSLALACPLSSHAETAQPLSESVAVDFPAPSRATDHVAVGFQSTYIWQRKPSLRALPASYPPGDSFNRLQDGGETAYTLSSTLLLGARLWRNTEIFVNPETVQSQNISGLHGLGGPSNGEAQRSGGTTPTLYLARAFVRQTIPLGGVQVLTEAGPNQFGKTTSSRRLVVTVGRMSILDVFDGNNVTHDPRTQFLNWALMTHGAFDYAADSRGYTLGAAVEYYHDAWAARLGRFASPKQSNGLALDYNLFKHYGDNLEIEHAHSLRGRPGRIRLLGFRNHEHMGAFADAVDFANTGLAASDACGDRPQDYLCNVRRDQAKYGIGIGVDQSVWRDADVFLRASWNDGKTETYSFTEIERSVVVGGVLRGGLWRRAADAFGAACVVNGISSEHQDYLRRGGIGFFIGDGNLDYRPEQLTEIYYSAAFEHLWVSLDYQHVANPAYNADRASVSFFGVRLHLEI